MTLTLPAFPRAQQAQISDYFQLLEDTVYLHSTAITVRANQRDQYHIYSLKEQTDAVLRSWFGQWCFVSKGDFD